MVYADQWTSAISPERPPVPREWHWATGLMLSAAILLVAIWQLSQNAIPEQGENIDETIIALGAPARRLEPPPEGVEVTDEPTIPDERADDAPPPAPPDQPRAVAASSDSGPLSSGTGAEASPPPPPPLAKAPPKKPPAPPKKVIISGNFVLSSRRKYQQVLRYPERALANQEQGSGVLRVTIDRQGNVLSAILVQSTGYRRLDNEIKRIAKLVSRLDPLPASNPALTAEADIPINFLIDYGDGAVGN